MARSRRDKAQVWALPVSLRLPERNLFARFSLYVPLSRVSALTLTRQPGESSRPRHSSCPLIPEFIPRTGSAQLSCPFGPAFANRSANACSSLAILLSPCHPGVGRDCPLASGAQPDGWVALCGESHGAAVGADGPCSGRIAFTGAGRELRPLPRRKSSICAPTTAAPTVTVTWE